MICLSSKSTPTYVDEVFTSLPFKPFFFLLLKPHLHSSQKQAVGQGDLGCAQNTFNICHHLKWLCGPTNEMSQMFENCLALLPS